MKKDALPTDLDEAVRFHGHLCPGLTIGYRAAQVGLDRLGSARAKDEELIAIVENDSCSVDAVQWLTGCTFGKGNLFFRDYGKQVFTFALRPSGRGVRVALKAPGELPPVPEGDREAKQSLLLRAPAESLFTITELTVALPEAARIRDSVPCSACGELVMVTRTRKSGRRALCIPCATPSSTRGPVRRQSDG